MTLDFLKFPSPLPLVIGCLGDADSLAAASVASLSVACHVAEIRLDLLHGEVATKGRSIWEHLVGFPMLFTARRDSEGSPIDLTPLQRQSLLRLSLHDASAIDIEVESIPEMAGFISSLGPLPWIASAHYFDTMPNRETLLDKAKIARAAGAAAFKIATRLDGIEDLSELVKFQLSEIGIPLITMGMGPLAPASRLLCAQAGSSLNYGFIGKNPTAPGQWPASLLKTAIENVCPIQ